MLLSFSGTLSFEPTEGDRPASVAMAFSLTYNQKSLQDLVYTGAVTNQAVGMGTITTPRAVLIEVSEGAMSFSWEADGSGAEVLEANAAPPPDAPAFKLLHTYDDAARTLYVTTTGPAKGRVWFFR
jgi:hypothetical protein